MLVVMLSKRGCNSLANYNEKVSSKVVVVGNSIVGIAVVIVVNICDLNIINFLSAILRFFWAHMLLLHPMHLLLH